VVLWVELVVVAGGAVDVQLQKRLPDHAHKVFPPLLVRDGALGRADLGVVALSLRQETSRVVAYDSFVGSGSNASLAICSCIKRSEGLSALKLAMTWSR
jgi:hypothetical protein